MAKTYRIMTVVLISILSNAANGQVDRRIAPLRVEAVPSEARTTALGEYQRLRRLRFDDVTGERCEERGRLLAGVPRAQLRDICEIYGIPIEHPNFVRCAANESFVGLCRDKNALTAMSHPDYATCRQWVNRNVPDETVLVIRPSRSRDLRGLLPESQDLSLRGRVAQVCASIDVVENFANPRTQQCLNLMTDQRLGLFPIAECAAASMRTRGFDPQWLGDCRASFTRRGLQGGVAACFHLAEARSGSGNFHFPDDSESARSTEHLRWGLVADCVSKTHSYLPEEETYRGVPTRQRRWRVCSEAVAQVSASSRIASSAGRRVFSACLESRGRGYPLTERQHEIRQAVEAETARGRLGRASTVARPALPREMAAEYVVHQCLLAAEEQSEVQSAGGGIEAEPRPAGARPAH